MKPLSVQNEYSLIFSGDPALRLPEDPEQRELALKNARDTGQWDALIQGRPVVFTFAPLKRTEVALLDGERNMSSTLGRPLGNLETNDLLIRLAIRSVTGLGDHKVTRTKWQGVYIAGPETIDAIHAWASEALIEFGNILYERLQVPIRPL